MRTTLSAVLLLAACGGTSPNPELVEHPSPNVVCLPGPAEVVDVGHPTPPLVIPAYRYPDGHCRISLAWWMDENPSCNGKPGWIIEDADNVRGDNVFHWDEVGLSKSPDGLGERHICQ